MFLRKLFRNIRLYFLRIGGVGIPYVSEQKYFGTVGEQALSQMIQEKIPIAHVKNNVIIQTKEGNAEIDCLVQIT